MGRSRSLGRSPGRSPALAAIVLAICTALTGCTAGAGDRAPSTRAHAVTVASFDFGESGVVAALYGAALERRGIPVTYRLHLGPREFVDPALGRGLVDVVPEYAGTATRFLGGGTVDAAAARVGAIALAAAPAQDHNAFVVTRATAIRHRLRTIGDLAPIAPALTFGGPRECATRDLCLRGLARVYEVRFGAVVALDAGGPVTLQALDGGEIDVGLLFTTNPALTRDDLVVLRDDRHLQPAENVTPLVRRAVVERYGTRLTATLDAVSRHLTTGSLRALNGAVTRGGSVHRIAREWLTEEAIA